MHTRSHTHTHTHTHTPHTHTFQGLYSLSLVIIQHCIDRNTLSFEVITKSASFHRETYRREQQLHTHIHTHTHAFTHIGHGKDHSSIGASSLPRHPRSNSGTDWTVLRNSSSATGRDSCQFQPADEPRMNASERPDDKHKYFAFISKIVYGLTKR